MKTLAVQSSPDLDLSKLDRTTILHGVEEVIGLLYRTSNVQYAVSVLDAFEKFQDISGFARANLLWGAQQWFTETGQDGDFYEKFGIREKNGQTYADRLIRMWDCIDSGKLPKSLYATRKVRELTPITDALSQGFVLSESVVKKLEQALDVVEISAILQKARGKQPRKGTLTLTVNSEGFITAWEDGQPHHAGTLNYADMETDPTVKKAVLRIKGGKAIIKDAE